MRSRLRTLVLSLITGAMLCVSPGLIAFASEPDMSAINSMDRVAFVLKFGSIFENSPWVAEKAWDKRPFASVGDLHAAMVSVARSAPIQNQLALLRGHPDLAGREAQAGAMTASSVSEQTSAGLDALSLAEMSLISDLNAAYKQKFGFPFIIAVRMYTKEGIFFEFNRRLQNDTPTEYANDLQNIYTITRLRLDKLLEGS